MRLRILVLPVLLAFGDSPVREPAGFHPPPRQVFVTGACTPAGDPGVNPPRIDVTRVDHIVWRIQSPRAASFTITPKDPEDWPFESMSFAGTRDAPAVTPEPLPNAKLNHVYSYNVTIVCTDGTVQVIDPEIVIGPGN